MGLVVIPAELLVATHLLAAFAGGLLVYIGVVHYGVRVLTHPRQRSEDRVPNRKLRRTTWLAIVVLIASGMVVAIGVMAALQRAHDREQEAERQAEVTAYSQCISEWGADLVEAANARNVERTTYDKAQLAYDRATAARADATADVVRLVLLLRRQPPEATAAQLDAALARATAADRRTDRAAERREEATAALDNAPAYKPPTLTCGRTP